MEEEKPTKKEERLAPRLEAKLRELKQRGLLENAKAYVPPQDASKKS